MTKLEEKLIELDYEMAYCHIRGCKEFYKYYHENKVVIVIDKNKIKRNYISSTTITNQDNINDLQKAYYLMQIDLQILKGV